MYRALIVDDEPIALDSIEYIIKNNITSIQIVGKSRSGRDAIEKAYNTRPDIIIMDINMPGINGLEAMRQIRRINPDVRLIVASAFDYFDYAVEAVALDVDEYLLKPVREARLVEALKKVISAIDERRERVRREMALKEKIELVVPVLETGFINSLCIFDDNAHELHNYCRLFDYQNTGGFVLVIEFGGRGEEGDHNKISAGIKSQKLYQSYRDILKSSCRCVVGPMMLNRLVVYVSDGHSETGFAQKTFASRLAKNFFDRAEALYPEIAIGLGRYYPDVEQARRSYHEALRALRMLSGVEQDCPVLHVEDIIEDTAADESDYESFFEREIYAAAAAGNTSGALLAFEDVFARMCAELLPDLELLKNKVVLMIVSFGKQGGSAVKSYCSVLGQVIEAETPERLRSICARYIEETSHQIASAKQKRISALIAKADSFIERNYASEISLEDIAREVNLSPYYFSHFYKDETGVNFIDKLTSIRIEKAKAALISGDLSVKEVSAMVGYSDPNYFSKLFKKITGLTATEYKEHYGK